MKTLIGPEESARRYREHQARRGALGGVVSGGRRRETNRERDARIIELHAAGWVEQSRDRAGARDRRKDGALRPQEGAERSLDGWSGWRSLGITMCCRMPLGGRIGNSR